MKKAFVALAALMSASVMFANDVAEIKAKIERDHKVIAVDQFHGLFLCVFGRRQNLIAAHVDIGEQGTGHRPHHVHFRNIGHQDRGLRRLTHCHDERV